MSKINAVRLINVNYNNNAIRISDECFHFQGDSTLISLRNGGGKSVLVQMMTAPFVHKRYRDAKDRPFESYFTTSKPSFILVEWVLDQDAGYVLAGMMVRRSQEVSGEGSEELEMVNIISEYRRPCLWDIHNLPVVEKKNKEITLKSFTACRQLFEQYKKDRSMEFFCYDMSYPAQTRQYFDKLKEYQINYKEWEAIIKKVNLKESGLSDLFSDCRDEKGLLEKWFLDAVESKLNREKNRMKEFQDILEKYVGQYQDNQSKILRRDRIRAFKEEGCAIREKAESYLKEEEEELVYQHKVASLMEELTRLREGAKERQEEILEKIRGMEQELLQIAYEKLSGEIHELERKLRHRVSSRDLLEAEQEDLEREEGRLEKKLHLLACAKQQELLLEEEQELETVKQKLSASQEKEARLAPERISLGGRLFWYYREALADNGQRHLENQDQHRQASEKGKELQEKLLSLEEAALKEASLEGALKSRVEAYDQWEERFLADYGEELVRNILGEYEPGSLDIRKEAYEKELEELSRKRQQKKKLEEKSLERQRNLERAQEELRLWLAKKEIAHSRQKEEKEGFDRELEERKVVLKYLDMEEKSLFDLEKILSASQRKLQEIDGLRENLEREKDGLQKEYRQLTTGKTLELPKELEGELQALGLPIVYGLEWLRKNGNTEEENRRLVRRHPFLPYGLMLSKKDLDKLAGNAGEIYTSFPVPILVREQLDKGEEKEAGGVCRMADISFYMLFNENLLNEEKLARMLQEMERRISRQQEAIDRRKREYQEYFTRQEQVKHQRVNKERFQAAISRLKELKGEQEGLEERLKEARKEAETLKQTLKALDQELRQLKEQAELGGRRLEDFKRLIKAYGQYRESRTELESCRRRMGKLAEKKSVALAGKERLEERLRTLESEANRLEQEREKLSEKQAVYGKYQDMEETALEEKEENAAFQSEDIRAMEARYAAITGNLSMELKELERQEKQAKMRCDKAALELSESQAKYGLEDGEWLGTAYDKREERHQESLLEGCRRKLKVKQGLCTEEKTAIAALEQQKKDRFARMAETCGKKEPLPQKEIQDRDFDARKNQLQYRKDEALKREAEVRAKLHSYNEVLSGLAEYSEFPLGEPVEWEQDFSAMDGEELRAFKGMLIRDYNHQVEARQRARGVLEQLLNRVVRMEDFQEDFYRKPLEAMLELTDRPDHVLSQLSTAISSYDSLMEKLEVDISLVEKEKLKIAELLEDYVREIHQNLDRIDTNSTITIREKPVKMLKIQLPAWEENENLYQIRIRDMIDEVTAKSLEILKENENAQEYFGAKLTTRNLYDAVIGIGNVQIRLYKIEEQREYPITWAEVAKNSGGEGFLSAFVILSSLLYYMRKEEGDIFADRNEGKVLLMDNPFAQTNASHLLKPLMDMAKKTNTQLICLTGLGGESIYSRFDNIYVLNLIAANLQGGMRYLKANHLRGREPETMAVSHIQVMEQQELIF